MVKALKLLLTGRPGIGKTTAIRQFLALTRAEAAGFYTEEIRQHGQRLGFSLNLLTGEQHVLSSVEISGRWRVGKYGVDVRTFESAAVPQLQKALAAKCLAVIDEIGKMELFSELFCATVWQIVEADIPVLGTILSRPHPFADQIRRAPGVTIVEVTFENRRRLPHDLARRFGFSVESPGT